MKKPQIIRLFTFLCKILGVKEIENKNSEYRMQNTVEKMMVLQAERCTLLSANNSMLERYADLRVTSDERRPCGFATIDNHTAQVFVHRSSFLCVHQRVRRDSIPFGRSSRISFRTRRASLTLCCASDSRIGS